LNAFLQHSIFSMRKEFNITGKIIPSLHYMADMSGKFEEIKDLIDRGRYFIINRPRQYGKTTTLNQLEYMLNSTGEYHVIRLSFEGIGDSAFENEQVFSPRFLNWLATHFEDKNPEMYQWLANQRNEAQNFEFLSSIISKFITKVGKKVALFIDEVDKSSNNQLFLHFLGLLRDKYLDRDVKTTFHAVVLAGVHDVKNLKLKLRPGEEAKFNSPWNIATDFKVDMNLQPLEIIPMLVAYSADTNVQIDAPKMADLLFYHTSGYPFLVSKLCKIIDEEILPKKVEKTWTEEDIDEAFQILLTESNTNFDNITKELENNKDLYKLTYDVLLGSEQYTYTPQDPIIALGVLYGLFKNGNGYLKVHNRIYAEMITNYFVSITKREVSTGGYDAFNRFTLPNNQLDLNKVLQSFQDLMRDEYNRKDRDFLEKNGRLIFLAFLKPILNGHGHTFKEPQISEEKRLDVVITYHQHKYIVELKIWRGEKAHKTGISQLVDYLDSQGEDKGYLIVFDHSGIKEWKSKIIRSKGKRIKSVWV
jgi:hypothetical protein